MSVATLPEHVIGCHQKINSQADDGKREDRSYPGAAETGRQIDKNSKTVTPKQ